MTTKVKGDKIKEGSIPFNALAPLNDTDKNQALANLGIADLLEALKPVRLSGDIPVGNVTQEQLDEIGLTEKVINNIINGYTNKIYINNIAYNIPYTYEYDMGEQIEFVLTCFYFDNAGVCTSLNQYKFNIISNDINIELIEL